MALTPKKRAFIKAVREGASNKDAAIAAGCPEKSASAAGSRLAKDPDVVAELHKLNALQPVNSDVKGVKAEDRTDSAPEDAEPAGFDLDAALSHRDPKDFLLAVMNDLGTEPKLRVDAAKALMPFVHQRKGEGGKKEQAKEKAAQVGQGRFGPRQPPNLKAVSGGKP
ncbi:terminase small subunit [Pseudomonas typographi]|uniref:Terminase small subunit n=2 Tax=Pseudomonas typographi TaxID=2715964 RepID=A0ABR7YZE6_9PSED|nr:terminase small subunit [Pseudomonas typographi]MBD1553624.1 terminase small subunit [Pseudomonas typographi]MBD1590188.1 terminase small subunit [Pseudomonas typographi]MBD1598588.1 terminase small subunit [Pseudomonas typographi]